MIFNDSGMVFNTVIMLQLRMINILICDRCHKQTVSLDVPVLAEDVEARL